MVDRALLLIDCRWSCWDAGQCEEILIPQIICNLINQNWPRSEVHLIDYKLCYGSRYNPLIPICNITYISTKPVHKTGQYNPLPSIIQASPNLHTLILRQHGRSSHNSDMRFPPLTALKIEKCGWYNSEAETRRLWDFSKLERLTLNETDNLRFVRCLPEIPTLKYLTVRDKPHFWLDRPKWSALPLVLGTRILQELDITCEFAAYLLKSVVKHAANLTVLRLHDHRQFSVPDNHCPTVSLEDLRSLRDNCPRLKEVSLDLDYSALDDFDILPVFSGCFWLHTAQLETFINILMTMTDLQELGLRMGTVIMEHALYEDGNDPDVDAKTDLANLLYLRKKGRRLRKLTVDAGGYHESIIGRGGEAWRAQRQGGHGPERFYSFSWDYLGRCDRSICMRWFPAPSCILYI